MAQFSDEIKFDDVFSSSVSHIAILNSHGEIITVNEPWKRFARENGCTDSRFFVGQNYLEVCRKARTSDKIAGKVYRALKSALQGNPTEFSLEYPCHSPVVERWFVMQIHGIELGEQKMAIVSHGEITSYRTSLFTTKALLDHLVHSLPDTIYTFDLVERRLTSFNRPSFLGYKLEELITLASLVEKVHADDVEAVTNQWQRLSGLDETDCLEYRLQSKVGDWEWVECRIHVMSEGAGGVPKDIIVILRVITERKQNEEQLSYQAKVLENVNDVIIGTDEKFNIHYWNSAAKRIFGWEAHEVMGKSASDVLRTEFVQGDREESIRAIMKTGVWRGDVTQYTKEGNPVSIDAHIMAIRDKYGKVTGYVSANRDISKRKQYEMNLLQSKEDTEAANLELQRGLEREQALSRTDGLTGLFNRRYFFELADQEFKIAKRYQLPFSLAIFDLDFFKEVNDRWGHQMGDEVLQHIGRIAQSQTRESDILARYGGEEFILLLPNSSARKAKYVVERIRTSISSYRIGRDEAGSDSITVSVGVAELTEEVDSLDHLIRHADDALYRAKRAGRNCVRLYSKKTAFSKT